jgi:hypothetical protein
MAILTRSAKDSAFIFCITWPRCAFTVISLMPRSAPTCLFKRARDYQGHDLPFALAESYIGLTECAHFCIATKSSATPFETLLDCAQKNIRVEWFNQEFDGPSLHSLDRRVYIGLVRDEYDRRVRAFDSNALLEV